MQWVTTLRRPARVVSRPDRNQSARLRHLSGSLVDFGGRRAVAFLICPLMCEILSLLLASILAAIEVLMAMDRSGARALPKRLPAVRLISGRHAQLMAWLDENCGFGCLVGYLHNE